MPYTCNFTYNHACHNMLILFLFCVAFFESRYIAVWDVMIHIKVDNYQFDITIYVCLL